MNQQANKLIITLVVIWSLKITMSASHSLQPEGHSATLNLLLEILINSNQDLADKLDMVQETLATHGSSIEDLRLQQSSIQSIETDISELNDRVLDIEEQYKTIKDDVKLDIQRESRNKMVAFSARVSPSYSDIQPGTTIIFSSVETNIGQGYNPKNGEFSAPVAGVYVFYSNILTDANKFIETRLVINGKIKLGLYSSGGQHMGPGSNLLVTHLEKGDIVKMMKYGPWGTKPFYIHHYWSTFSGFLLVPDI